jgi:DNA-damage-inducible protein J
MLSCSASIKKEGACGMNVIGIQFNVKAGNIMKTPLQLRVDDNVKKDASDLFSDLGLSLSDAVNVFLKKAVVEGGFPFEVKKTPFEMRMDEATREMKAYEKHPEDYTAYDSADVMIEDIMNGKI